MFSLKLPTAALALLAAASSHAAVIQVHHDFNPANVTGYGISEALSAPQAIATGDTLILTYTFGGGTVTLSPEATLISVVAHGSTEGWSGFTSARFSFSNPSANLVALTPALSLGFSGNGISGLTFDSDFRSAAGPVSFDAMTVTFTNIQLNPGSQTMFNSIGFYSDGTFSWAGATAVPEPATWALMIAGFGLVGTALRRRTPATA